VQRPTGPASPPSEKAASRRSRIGGLAALTASHFLRLSVLGRTGLGGLQCRWCARLQSRPNARLVTQQDKQGILAAMLRGIEHIPQSGVLRLSDHPIESVDRPALVPHLECVPPNGPARPGSGRPLPSQRPPPGPHRLDRNRGNVRAPRGDRWPVPAARWGNRRHPHRALAEDGRRYRHSASTTSPGARGAFVTSALIIPRTVLCMYSAREPSVRAVGGPSLASSCYLSGPTLQWLGRDGRSRLGCDWRLPAPPVRALSARTRQYPASRRHTANSPPTRRSKSRKSRR
jgi:hypothetical protein